MTEWSSEPRRGFTLVELLVVIGVIVLLVGILIPTVTSALRRAGRMRAQADLQTIATGLEAYRQDFGDYPRLPVGPNGQPVANTGAATLGKALLGPFGDGVLPGGGPDLSDPPPIQSTVPYKAGDCVMSSNWPYVAVVDNTNETPATAGTYDPYWSPFDPRDGADGPGFRLRIDPQTKLGMGKVWGPYIQSGKIKNQGCALLDQWGGPILYFPARPGQINVNRPSGSIPPGSTGYVDSLRNGISVVTSRYDADDNFEPFRRRPNPADSTSWDADSVVLARIRIMLGDVNTNGWIGTGGTPVSTPYILWSAGPDGIFGPAGYTPQTPTPTPAQIDQNTAAVQKCDDVTNFQQ